jgi:hypothetical protein
MPSRYQPASALGCKWGGCCQGSFAVQASAVAVQPHLSRQPRAPRFSLACFKSLAPGMGTAPCIAWREAASDRMTCGQYQQAGGQTCKRWVHVSSMSPGSGTSCSPRTWHMHQLMATWDSVLRRRVAISRITSSSGSNPGSTCLHPGGGTGSRRLLLSRLGSPWGRQGRLLNRRALA